MHHSARCAATADGHIGRFCRFLHSCCRSTPRDELPGQGPVPPRLMQQMPHRGDQVLVTATSSMHQHGLAGLRSTRSRPNPESQARVEQLTSWSPRARAGASSPVIAREPWHLHGPDRTARLNAAQGLLAPNQGSPAVELQVDRATWRSSRWRPHRSSSMSTAAGDAPHRPQRGPTRPASPTPSRPGLAASRFDDLVFGDGGAEPPADGPCQPDAP